MMIQRMPATSFYSMFIDHDLSFDFLAKSKTLYMKFERLVWLKSQMAQSVSEICAAINNQNQ